jgi:hypothetical protein
MEAFSCNKSAAGTGRCARWCGHADKCVASNELSVQSLMSMTEADIDAELRSLGVSPEDAAIIGKKAMERAKS